MKPKKYPGAVGELIELGISNNDSLHICNCNLHGVTSRIAVNSRAVADALGHFLRAFPAADDATPDIEMFLFTTDELDDTLAPVPAAATMLYDWGMVKILRDGDYRFEKVDRRARVAADVVNGIAAGFAETSLLQTDWLVTNLFFYPLWAQLMKSRGLFPLHAAGLVRDGRSALLLGKSGSGKSTLSIHLVKAGYGLLSDDTVFLREDDGTVESLSFPEEINVTENTIAMIPELAGVDNFTANPFRDKSSFPIEELYPGCIVDAAVPSVLIFPEVTGSTDTVVEAMSGSEALTLSMRYGFFFMDPATTARHFEVLAALVKQVSCFRLYSGSDQVQLNEKIGALLQEHL
ncbi:MAG: phosphoenolpyruvate carboxykinase (ATP) [Thermoleophilia bacterium]